MRKKCSNLQGKYGTNPVRLAISHYVVSRLRIPAPLKITLDSAMRPRSIIYDDDVFISLCRMWIEQETSTFPTDAETRTLGKQIIDYLVCKAYAIDDIAVSLFPAFGVFLTKEESPGLHDCVCI